MEYPQYIQQMIDAGIAYCDMDGAVRMNPAFAGGGASMPAVNIQINTNCGNTYNTYNNYNFYGDHAAMNDIHDNDHTICK